MATIGTLGTVAFQVSDKTIETFNNFQWECEARYAKHERHGGYDLVEFTGISAETITFDLELSAYLGVSPKVEVEKLRTLLQEGTAVPLVLGEKVFGRYRWVVTSMKTTVTEVDRDGDIARATVNVSLLEYL